MQISLTVQLTSFTGAMLILIAYIGHQARWMSARSVAYNLLNVLGAAILAWVAFRPLQLVFVILEATWTLVSLWALVKVLRGGQRTVPEGQ